MTDFTALDHPIWGALTTAHRAMALRHGLAARYPADVSPLAAMCDPTPGAFADLRALLGAGEGVALFTDGVPDVPDDWQILRSRLIDQMVCTNIVKCAGPVASQLEQCDVADMLALTSATEPGPFLPNTVRMGKYIGVRSPDGRLMAMAGQRLSLDGFVEISAVCTDPDFRGKGLARALVVSLAQEIFGQGRIPFLHVKTENTARIVYEKVGFAIRRAIQFTVITPR
jgi:ribosomal protein S18 acetylase RimI-like enzyme